MAGPPDESDLVQLRADAGVAWMTLNNPVRRNAITGEMASRICECCDAVDADESIGVVVIQGAGTYFCSGADTRDLASAAANPASPEAVTRISAVYNAFVRVGTMLPPVVALVRGGAVGAGMNLALMAEVIVTTPSAVLDSGFLARSVHPGGGHLALLGRRLGYGRASMMSLMGRPLVGDDAVAHGLADVCVAEDEMEAFVTELVTLPASDPALTRRVKASLRLEVGPPGIPLTSALEVERGAQMWSMARKGDVGWDRRWRS